MRPHARAVRLRPRDRDPGLAAARELVAAKRRGELSELARDVAERWKVNTDGGRLVVAHAGMKGTMHGRGSGQVRSFALYGETTGGAGGSEAVG